jgi:hypothetical protein
LFPPFPFRALFRRVALCPLFPFVTESGIRDCLVENGFTTDPLSYSTQNISDGGNQTPAAPCHLDAQERSPLGAENPLFVPGFVWVACESKRIAAPFAAAAQRKGRARLSAKAMKDGRQESQSKKGNGAAWRLQQAINGHADARRCFPVHFVVHCFPWMTATSLTVAGFALRVNGLFIAKCAINDRPMTASPYP